MNCLAPIFHSMTTSGRQRASSRVTGLRLMSVNRPYGAIRATLGGICFCGANPSLDCWCLSKIRKKKFRMFICWRSRRRSNILNVTETCTKPRVRARACQFSVFRWSWRLNADPDVICEIKALSDLRLRLHGISPEQRRYLGEDEIDQARTETVCLSLGLRRPW